MCHCGPGADDTLHQGVIVAPGADDTLHQGVIVAPGADDTLHQGDAPKCTKQSSGRPVDPEDEKFPETQSPSLTRNSFTK